jgi:hypothetical protein
MTSIRRTPAGGAPGLWRCQFCINGLHRSCPGAIRSRDRVWICSCSECTHVSHCLECRHASPEDLDRAVWRCVDRRACEQRQYLRMTNNPLWRQLQEHKAKAVSDRRRIREQAERILVNVDPYEDEDADPTPRLPRLKVGVCLCCGAMTKGGKFAPGHDSKYRSQLRKEAAAGSTEAAQKIRDLGWENH